MVAGADALLGTEVRRFKLVRLIGRGGMGRVYEGVRSDIGSRVAIKVIAEQYAHEPEHAERFFAEARAVNMIRHDGIVNIFDLDRLPDGRPVIVMEFVEGSTLRQCMTKGRLPLGGLVVAIAQVLEALSAAHAIGVVHRDLKPDNIMIMPSGRAKVLDFGIAKLLRPPEGQPAPHTRTGAVIGTPEYMAPEQIDEGIADPRTDIYAMGIVLFEAITGRRPFEGPSDYAIMRAQIETPVPSLRAARNDVPSDLEHVIMAALAKRPRDRFHNTLAMRHALSQAALAISEDQWRPLIPDGVVMRDALATAPTDPGPGESLPTSPRIALPDASPSTVRETPHTRNAKSDALRSGHHTAEARRAPLVQEVETQPSSPGLVETRPSRPGLVDRNVPTRPSMPEPTASARPSQPEDGAMARAMPRTRKRRLLAGVAGVGAVAIAALAVALYPAAGEPEPPPGIAVQHVGNDGAALTLASIDARGETAAPVPEPAGDSAPRGSAALAGSAAPMPTNVVSSKRRPQSPVATQSPRSPNADVDAGIVLAMMRADASDDTTPVSTGASNVQVAAASQDPLHGPIPAKYRQIAGAEIDETTPNYNTSSRVSVTQPFPDLTKLELSRYAGTAKQLARKFESDAELTEIQALVYSDGTLVRGPLYYFSSRRALASNDRGRLACIVVDVQPWGNPVVVARGGNQTGCDTWTGTRVPRCSLSEIVSRAPAGHPKLAVYYGAKGWRIGAGLGGSTIAEFPDDC